jgi:hypothetical protein
VIGLTALIAIWALAPTAWLLVDEYSPSSGATATRLLVFARVLWIAVGVFTMLLVLRLAYVSTRGVWNGGAISWNVVVDIVRIAIWPLVVLVSLTLFREPLGAFFNALGTRASRIGAFNLTIELADVPVARPWSGPTLDDLKLEYPVMAGDSSRSLFTAIADTTQADYLTVNLEDGEAWLTSRLFILATLVPRIRAIKRIVFLSDPAEEFVGDVKPSDLTSVLATEYPWLEKAYIVSHVYAAASAGGCELRYNNTLLGPLKPTEGDGILGNFLFHIKGQPADAQRDPSEWIDLGHYNEHAKWVTKDLLLQLLGKKLNRYFVKRDPTVKELASSETLLRTEADYVAIVDTFNRFHNLVDRHRALDEVVRREIAKS